MAVITDIMWIIIIKSPNCSYKLTLIWLWFIGLK